MIVSSPGKKNGHRKRQDGHSHICDFLMELGVCSWTIRDESLTLVIYYSLQIYLCGNYVQFISRVRI